MSWGVFEVMGGGLVRTQPWHVVTACEEACLVKLLAAASDLHVVKNTTGQQARLMVIGADGTERAGSV